jgi:hypothetical protein
MIQVCALSVEPFAAVLFLIGAGGQTDVGLTCNFALLEWIHVPSKIPAQRLLAFDGLEEGFEIALAEAAAALPLDDFEK